MAQASLSEVIVTNDACSVDSCLLNYWHVLENKPKCIVFDLDFTLWPFVLDSVKILPPFRFKSIGTNNEKRDQANFELKVVDSQSRVIEPYAQVDTCLRTLRHCYLSHDDNEDDEKRIEKREVVKLAVASRSTTSEDARTLLDMFDWSQYFQAIEIFSGSKQAHMKNIRRQLDLANYDDMLFFDDNKLNIKQTQSLGLVAYQLHRKNGLNLAELRNGLTLFNKTKTINN